MQNTKKFKVPLPSFQFSVSLASLQTTLQYDNSSVFLAMSNTI